MTDAGLADQLEQVELDLADLDDQVASGDLDTATADRLRATYLAEAERLGRLLAEPGSAPPPGRSRARVIAGGLVLGLGLVVIVMAAVASLGDRPPGGNVTGGVATDVLTGGGVDLEQVSNEELEAVVADNPDVVGMRMALARRYFEEGEFASALTHYMYILEDMGRQEPEALANVGWMTALSGRPEVGLEFVQQALEVEPQFPQAYWFLANIDAVLDDPCGAAEAVAALLEFDDVPEDIRTEAEALLDTSKAGCDG